MTAKRDRYARRTKRTACGITLAAVLAFGAASRAQDDAGEVVATIGSLVWTLTTNGEDVPWSDANQHCETLELARYDDWRLPTLTELESLYDPSAQDRGRIVRPFELDDCCIWSATSLAEVAAEAKGVLPPPANDASGYYWGFLFPSGVRYYSFQSFPDGQALCVRVP